jgi:hypothetical protein
MIAEIDPLGNRSAPSRNSAVIDAGASRDQWTASDLDDQIRGTM